MRRYVTSYVKHALLTLHPRGHVSHSEGMSADPMSPWFLATPSFHPPPTPPPPLWQSEQQLTHNCWNGVTGVLAPTLSSLISLEISWAERLQVNPADLPQEVQLSQDETRWGGGVCVGVRGGCCCARD